MAFLLYEYSYLDKVEKAKDCITLIESNPLEEFDETEQNKAVIRLLQELGTFTEQQMQVCYLMRIGLSKTQIQGQDLVKEPL